MLKPVTKPVVQKKWSGRPLVLSAVAGLMLLIAAPIQVIAQTCNSHITPTTPDSRYTDNADGTVTDKQTGLMWKQCEEGQSGAGCAIGSALTFTWAAALQRSETLNTTGGFAGHTDWRLPNIKELASLVERACDGPSINNRLFPATPSSNVWSSSPDASYSDSAWYVYFGNGYSSYYDYRDNYYQVRLVRSGQ